MIYLTEASGAMAWISNHMPSKVWDEITYGTEWLHYGGILLRNDHFSLLYL